MIRLRAVSTCLALLLCGGASGHEPDTSYGSVYDVIYRLDGHEIQSAEPEPRGWIGARDGEAIRLPGHAEHLQIHTFESPRQADARARKLHVRARLEQRPITVFTNANALLVLTPGASEAVDAIRDDLESDSWRPGPALRKRFAERQAARAEAAARARAVDERARQARMDRADAERRRLAEEGAARRAALAARNAELQRLAGLYARTITTKIGRSWEAIVDTDVQADCIVEVAQSHAGDVLDVRVWSCEKGSVQVHDAVSRAVRGASPLPAPPDPELFDRRVRIRFVSPERAE